MQIEIKNISKSYGKKEVLKSVSFSAKEGQCIGILGANGSGKSTLLSILAGVLRPDSGEFLYDKNNLFDYKKELGTLIGYVPQGTPLIEELSARDNLLMWYNKKHMEKELCGGVLEKLGIGEFLKLPVSKMSGGMKKRLSIGCAVFRNPPILLLDEPMAALDIACKKKILDYLKDHLGRGGIIIIVTHDIMELELCDTSYIIKDGMPEEYSFMGDLNELIKRL